MKFPCQVVCALAALAVVTWGPVVPTASAQARPPEPGAASGPSSPKEKEQQRDAFASISSSVTVAEELAKTGKEIELLETRLSLLRSVVSQAGSLADEVRRLPTTLPDAASIQQDFAELVKVLNDAPGPNRPGKPLNSSPLNP